MTLTATRSRTAGLLTALTMTALLAACSADDSGSDAVSGDVSSETSQTADGRGLVRELGQRRRAVRAAARTPAARRPTPPTERPTHRASPDRPTAAELQRSVISSGTVSLAGEDVRATRQDVQRVVDAQGGEITEETTETDSDGDTSYVRMVVRVPSRKFGETMSALEQVGVLRSSDRGSEDVTTQVIDNGARVRAQEASLRARRAAARRGRRTSRTSSGSSRSSPAARPSWTR